VEGYRECFNKPVILNAIKQGTVEILIDTLDKSFDILKSKIKLPEEDELLASPVHYDHITVVS